MINSKFRQEEPFLFLEVTPAAQSLKASSSCLCSVFGAAFGGFWYFEFSDDPKGTT